LAIDGHELITTTRGVRKRIDYDRPVSYEVLEECIADALQAPVGDEAWTPQFVVVLDAELKQQIGAAYQKVNVPYIDGIEARALKGADPSEHDRIRAIHGTYRWQGENFGRTPAMVIVGMQGRYETESQMIQASAYGSIFPAAWSLMLALRMRGLGACWTTLHLDEADAVSKLLKLPEDFTQGVLLPIGYFTGEKFKPAGRPPASTLIHRDGW